MSDSITLNNDEYDSVKTKLLSSVDEVEFKTELDKTALLAQITNETPTGVDVRTQEAWITAYYKLRDTRNQLRRRERETSANGQLLSIPDHTWQPVILQATALLTTATKDVEIVAWLIEGMMRLHGFTGLHDGLLLLHQLIAVYGKSLFPLTDNEEDRFSALFALSGDYHEGTLVYPINLSPLIFTSEHSISYWDYAQMQLAKSSAQNRNLACHNKESTFFSILNEMSEADVELNDALTQTIENCLCYIDKIETLITSYFAIDNFSWMSIREKIKQCLEAQQHLLRFTHKHQYTSLQQIDEKTLTNLKPSSSAEKDGLTALAHLEKAYAIFRLEQPHSPITSSLARILRWANQDLNDLVNELIPDSQARQLFCLITGANSSLLQNTVHNNFTHYSDDREYEQKSENF